MKNLFYLLFVFFLFQCEKNQDDSDKVKILKSYTEHPILGISDTIYLNTQYFFQKSNSRSFTVKSYFDKKTISFNRGENTVINNLDQFKLVKVNIDLIKRIKNKSQKFYVVSNPIISEDKKYAILEAGIFNYQDKGFVIIGASKMPDLVHVFLYKKEKDKWKRLELITQIRL